MASSFIDRIQIGNDQIAIGSSAYAICNTPASTPTKTATISGFYLHEGTTIYIKFNAANTASNPKLNISGTGDIPIVQYGVTVAGTADGTTGWEDGAVLSFTLTKENDNWYWSKVSGYSVDTHYTASLISGTSSSTTNTPVSSGNNIYLRLFDGGTNQSNLQLEEGNNMTISSDANGVITFTATDTTYSNFVQSGSSAAAGLVPAPGSTAGSDLFLCENGTWATPNYTTSLALSAITGTDNLQAIEALQGTGLLEKTISGWTLDTNTYLTSQNTAYIYATTENGTSNASNETNPYLTLIDGTTTSRVQLEGNGQTSIVADSGVITISTNITAADLGLSNALHFIGMVSISSTYQPSDGTAPNPESEVSPTSLTLVGGIVYNNPTNGDVILDSAGIREYIWIDDVWKMLGFSSSEIYSQPPSTVNQIPSNQWISKITQNTDGTISATLGTLDTSGTWTGDVTTSIDTTNELYLLGVTSNATNTLKRNTNIKIQGTDITAGVWKGTTINPNKGGTGIDNYTKGDILYASSTIASTETTALSKLTLGNSGTVLHATSDGPRWYNGLTLSGAGTNNSPYLATFNGNLSISGGITFDDSDTYGDEYTPIYWNNGVPEEVNVVKKYTFTIANGATTTIITPTNTNKAKSIVTEIVVDSGMAYLNGAISWNIPDTGDNKDKIVLSTTTTSGAVGGYILVSIGG